jgi:DNA-binding CsgD family transcriptional regulator
MPYMHKEADGLRPIERVVTRLRDQGVSAAEIGRRVGKRPGTVDRILSMVEMKEGVPASSRARSGYRPIERVVRRLRAGGESYGEIGHRLGKSGQQIRRIEGYMSLKADL